MCFNSSLSEASYACNVTKLLPLQANAEKGNSSEDGSASNVDKEEAVSIVTPSNGSQSVNVLVSGLEALDVSSNNDLASRTSDLGEAPNPGTAGEDIEKRIRALKKKVRFRTFSAALIRISHSRTLLPARYNIHPLSFFVAGKP